jgi:hypothetical protein
MPKVMSACSRVLTAFASWIAIDDDGVMRKTAHDLCPTCPSTQMSALRPQAVVLSLQM